MVHTMFAVFLILVTAAFVSEVALRLRRYWNHRTNDRRRLARDAVALLKRGARQQEPRATPAK